MNLEQQHTPACRAVTLEFRAENFRKFTIIFYSLHNFQTTMQLIIFYAQKAWYCILIILMSQQMANAQLGRLYAQAYNVSTVRASDKCSIIANRKSTTCFPTSYRPR